MSTRPSRRPSSGAAEFAVEEFAAEEDDGGAAVGAGDAEVAGFEVADEGGHFVECQGTSGLDGGSAGEGPAEAVGGGEALEVGGLGFGDDFAEIGGGVDAAEGRGHGAEQPGGGAEGSDVEAEALEIVGVRRDPVAFLGAEFDAGWIEELLGGGVGGVAEALEEDAFVGGVLVDEIEATGTGGDDVGAVDLAERTHDGGAEAGGGLCMVVGWDVGRRSAACAQVATRGRSACLPAGAVGREEELVDDWAVEAGGGDFGGGGEGSADSGGEAAEDFAGAAEADLGLGGMDVDVDFLGGNGQVQHDHGEATGGHDAAVGLAYGGGEEAVADPAAVDEKGDVGSGRALEVGLGDEAVDAEGLAGRELDELVDERCAVDGEEGVAEVAVAGGADALAVSVVEGEGDVGMAEGGAGDGGDDVTELSAFGLEELKAGRDGAEEAADGDPGAAGAADGAFLDDAFVAGEDLAARLALGGDGSQR